MPGVKNQEWAQAADNAKEAAASVGEMACHAASAVGGMASQAACDVGKRADDLTASAGVGIQGWGDSTWPFTVRQAGASALRPRQQ